MACKRSWVRVPSSPLTPLLMKRLSWVLPVFALLLQASMCNPEYKCNLQCYGYLNDSIVVCRTSYASAESFTSAVDSLNQVYGMGNSFSVDSIIVSGYSSHAKDEVARQLEMQGYSCELE